MRGKDNPSNPLDWSSSDLRTWLKRNGFEHYVEVLVNVHRLNGRSFLMLNQDDLTTIGLSVLGDIKNMIFLINQLRFDSGVFINENDPSKIRLSYCLLQRPPLLLQDIQSDLRGRCPASSSSSTSEADAVHAPEINGKPPHLQRTRVLPAERIKTLFAFLYVLIVSWLTAFVMVIVHDRVPDMERYPPLPDILLDNIPHIPWAFEMCEITGMVLLAVWITVCTFHKHRFILMRRFFSISGTIFFLRCITMLITSLSVPGKHLDCAPRPYGDAWNKLYNTYIIWTGAGMTLQGVRTCGDYMFSGHTVSLTLLNFFITEYTSRRVYFLHTFTWICNVFGVFFILAAHEHYSIDVFVAFYISSRLFLYYHTLANNRALQADKDHNRTWFWFPLFSYFESQVDGKVPNEFEYPVTCESVRDYVTKVKQWVATPKEPEKIVMHKNGKKQRNKKKIA